MPSQTTASENPEKTPRRSRWQWLRDAFATDTDTEPLTEPQKALLDRMAKAVVRRGMATPAILFLDSVKPLSFLGSQVMVFFAPIVRAVFQARDFMELQKILERRRGVEMLLERIEHWLAELDEPSRKPSHEPSQSEEGGQEASQDRKER